MASRTYRIHSPARLHVHVTRGNLRGRDGRLVTRPARLTPPQEKKKKKSRATFRSALKSVLA